MLNHNNRRPIIRISLYFLLTIYSTTAQSAVWQWSVAIKGGRQNQGIARAYLWVPENCKQIKAFVFAQNNMEEHSILENELFRKELASLNMAEVWVSPAYDLTFNFANGAGEIFNTMLNDLANVSGYVELNKAPFVGMGHSAAASSPYYVAAWDPARTIAAISVSGQWPYFRDERFAPDVWQDKNINFIPCLETMGEYEAAYTWAKEGLKQRKEHPLLPLSMLACPGEGHFAASQQKINFLALFIKKAIKYRLGAAWGKAGSNLIPLDPTKQGWLAERWIPDHFPSFAPAPVGQYGGDKNDAFWYFDEETVREVQKYQARYRGRTIPLVGYLQDGRFVEQRNTHQQVNLSFRPLNDGITFKVQAAFYDTVPGGSPRPAMWTGKLNGALIEKPQNARISIDRITGPVVKVNDSLFRIEPQPGFPLVPHSYEAWFIAVSENIQGFKPTAQQALMPLPLGNKEGVSQRITFKAIGKVRRRHQPIRLWATSDSGLPVSYYVAEGPALLNDGKLVICKIPPKAKYPVKIRVVAWQYGSTAGRKVQTAEPIEQTIFVR